MFVGAWDVDGLRWAEHLVFAVDGYFSYASGDSPSFGTVAMPLVGESAVGLDAQSFDLEAGTSSQHFV